MNLRVEYLPIACACDEWTCRICGTENLEEEDICHECGAYPYEEAYDAISDEEDEAE